MDEDVIRDLLADLGSIRIKRMFGGLGIYADDLMFAFEADGELFIKADAETCDLFERAGSSIFSYQKSGGKVLTMRYWKLPESALDDPDEAARWGRYGIEAARRGAREKADSGKRTTRKKRAVPSH